MVAVMYHTNDNYPHHQWPAGVEYNRGACELCGCGLDSLRSTLPCVMNSNFPDWWADLVIRDGANGSDYQTRIRKSIGSVPRIFAETINMLIRQRMRNEKPAPTSGAGSPDAEKRTGPEDRSACWPQDPGAALSPLGCPVGFWPPCPPPSVDAG